MKRPDNPPLDLPSPGNRKKPGRGLVDLGNLLGSDSSQPAAEKTTSSPRNRAAKMSDLFSKIENDQPQPATLPPPKDTPEAGPAVESPAPPLTTPQRERRGGKSLDNIFDSLAPDKSEKRPVAKTPERPRPGKVLDLLSEEQQPAEEELTIQLPPELEQYLPPDLWRDLNSRSARRGSFVKALERLRSVLFQLSTFLPQHLVQEMMRNPVAGLAKGQMITGSLLFSDVSGFTALSERLAVLGPEGAEHLTEIMNRYFIRMLEILSWSGGILLKFAGDATLVYFPQQKNGAQALWAARAGQRMLQAMKDFATIDSPTEKVSLKMKIGVATGDFLAASLGSEKRMEYGIFGGAVNLVMAAEGATKRPGQMVIDQATATLIAGDFQVNDHIPGFFTASLREGQRLDNFEIRAEQRRARGAIPWDASPLDIAAQIELVLRQIKALTPYLAPELVERLLAHSQQRRVDSEFRPVAVMFCNFQGAEALLEMWGKDGIRRTASVLSAYFNAMHDTVRSYGGMVSRIDPYSKGVKMLILFGAPISHEDDPQRAVSTALTMNVELTMLNERLTRQYARHLPPGYSGPLIEHRIGITLGEIYAGMVGSPSRREYTVMGDDVNLAARLMGAARMGQILLSPRLFQQVDDHFICTRLHPIRVKGKSKPIEIAQVDGPRDNILLHRSETRSLLIGRSSELAKGIELLENAKKGESRLLTIYGPSGIGKSHLADEIIKKSLGMNFKALATHCRSYSSSTPYACWSSILRSLAGISSIDLPQVHLEKLQQLVAELGIDPRQTASLATLMGIRPPAKEPDGSEKEQSNTAYLMGFKEGRIQRRRSSLDTLLSQLDESQQTNEVGLVWQMLPPLLTGREREHIYSTAATLFKKLLDRSPALIFFEDAHWMDPGSRDLLQHLLAELKEKPIIFLLAQRGHAPERTARDKEKQRIDLELSSLSLQETNSLVAYVLTAELAPLIHQQSNGNPLFVEQITRWIQQSRKIGPDDLREMLQTSNILQKMVLSNLEKLPEGQRETARLASVVGNEFHASEVTALLPASIDRVTLSNHLNGITRAGLVQVIEKTVDKFYAFQQPLVRDVLYNSLPFEKRRELHARIADHLSAPRQEKSELSARIGQFLGTQVARNPAQEAAVIADHYEKAERYQDAASKYIQAAALAYSQQERQKAGEYNQRALDNLNAIAPETSTEETQRLRIQAQSGLGDIAMDEGNYAAAAAAYEAAWSILPESFELPARQHLASRLALALPTQGRAKEALVLLDHLIERYDLSAQAGLAAIQSWLYWRGEDPHGSEHIQHALELLAPAAGEWVIPLQTLLTDLAGNWKAARQAYRVLRLSTGAALAAVRQGDRLLAQQATDQALALYQQASQLWQETDDCPAGLALACYRTAEAHWQAGNAEDARQALNRMLEYLATSPASIRSEGRDLARQALNLIDKKRQISWPRWRWYALDDAFRINIMVQM